MLDFSQTIWFWYLERSHMGLLGLSTRYKTLYSSNVYDGKFGRLFFFTFKQSELTQQVRKRSVSKIKFQYYSEANKEADLFKPCG